MFLFVSDDFAQLPFDVREAESKNNQYNRSAKKETGKENDPEIHFSARRCAASFVGQSCSTSQRVSSGCSQFFRT